MIDNKKCLSPTPARVEHSSISASESNARGKDVGYDGCATPTGALQRSALYKSTTSLKWEDIFKDASEGDLADSLLHVLDINIGELHVEGSSEGQPGAGQLQQGTNGHTQGQQQGTTGRTQGQQRSQASQNGHSMVAGGQTCKLKSVASFSDLNKELAPTMDAGGSQPSPLTPGGVDFSAVSDASFATQRRAPVWADTEALTRNRNSNTCQTKSNTLVTVTSPNRCLNGTVKMGAASPSPRKKQPPARPPPPPPFTTALLPHTSACKHSRLDKSQSISFTHPFSTRLFHPQILQCAS